MTQYDPHRWRDHLLDVKGSMLHQITGRILLCVLWAAAVVIAHRFGPSLAVPSTPHALVGVALGLLLVFRTNASYDRFWEGRRLWGSIVNECRNLGRQARALIRPRAPSLYADLMRWTAAFPYACMHLLRGSRSLAPFPAGFPPADREKLEKTDHPPLAISVRLTELLREAQEQGALSDYARAVVDANVQQLVDCIGGCERIHKTPLPFAYVVHLRRALILYCFSLPFALVGDFGAWTVLAVAIVAYVLIGIEEIGVQIEDPFGADDNDLPLEKICATIEYNLASLTDAS